MSDQNEKKTPIDTGRPIVRDYTIVCMAALALITLLLSDLGLGWWSVLPFLIGAPGILANWSLTPTLVLWCLIMLLLGTRHSPMQTESDFLSEVILSFLALIYLTSATRLLALRKHIVPPDARLARRASVKRIRGRWMLPRANSNRSSSRISSREILTMLLTAPVFLAISYLVYMRLMIDESPWWFNFSEQAWRLTLLIWGGGIVLATTGAFLAFLDRIQASPEESLLYLQDQVWRETRGEQRRINRWITWARLRRQEREEHK